ncbi:helix-turn-helix domain-containing protein [Streptomyces sp. NPDC001889]
MTRPTARPTHARVLLADCLAGIRRSAGLTFAELAAATGRSVPTLKRAAGRTAPVPKEDTVTAYVRGCGQDSAAEQEALRLWRRARAAERGILRGLRAPAPALVRNRADLAAALAAAYEDAGAPPLRVLQERGGRAGGVPVLPLTTAWRVTQRRCPPGNAEQFEAFLRGCGVTEASMPDWREAWKRATASPAAGDAVVRLADLRGGHHGVFGLHDLGKVNPAFQRMLAHSDVSLVESVLEAGLVQVAAARAQRNGTTADGPDIIWRVPGGKTVLVEVKRQSGGENPSAGLSPVPAPRGPAGGPGQGVRREPRPAAQRTKTEILAAAARDRERSRPCPVPPAARTPPVPVPGADPRPAGHQRARTPVSG